MQCNRQAPLWYKSSIEIATPIEAVWAILVDIPNWSQWNADITEANLNGPLQPGTMFRWKAKGTTITSRLQEVDAPHLIGWTGKTMGIKAVHVYTLVSKGDKTVVTSEESWEGLIVQLAKGYLRKTLISTLDSGLASLKDAAQKPS